MSNPDECRMIVNGSLAFDLLDVASIFGLMNEGIDMVRLGHYWSKDVWKKRVWKRAWE